MQQWRRPAFLLFLLLLAAGWLANLQPRTSPTRLGAAPLQQVTAEGMATPQVLDPSPMPENGLVGTVTTDAAGVRITVMPRIQGAPFTAFSVVVPVASSSPGSILVTVTPSSGELMLAKGDPTNLQVIDLLTSAPLACSPSATELVCSVDGPGTYAVQVSEAAAGGRGAPAPITALPQQGAGVISVGSAPTPTPTPLPPAAP